MSLAIHFLVDIYMTNIKPKTCKLVRDPPLPPWGKGGRGLGALIRTANNFQNSDFPTPRGYGQAVHPPFNSSSSKGSVELLHRHRDGWQRAPDLVCWRYERRLQPKTSPIQPNFELNIFAVGLSWKWQIPCLNTCARGEPYRFHRVFHPAHGLTCCL